MPNRTPIRSPRVRYPNANRSRTARLGLTLLAMLAAASLSGCGFAEARHATSAELGIHTDGSPAPATASDDPTAISGPTCDSYWIGMEWGNADGGKSLITSPSQCARDSGYVALDDAWNELITITPDADVAGMRDQLACHLIGAPAKETWNLEPWRPAVGLRATIENLCNPT